MATKKQQQIYRMFLNGYAAVAGSKRAKVADAFLRYRRKLDLNDPKTLADKVSWIELNTDQALAARCTDKWEVRNFVADRGLEKLLIPAYGPWSQADDINVESLPQSFVLKATHGCEMNYIVPDKMSLNVDDMVACAQRWLSCDYGRACVEPHYKLIPHRVYAEDFIGGMDQIVDYKIHCLNGEPRFILTCSERNRGLKLNLYDMEWNSISGIRGTKKNDKEILRPSRLPEMIEAAKTLCAGFDFVRVDLYQIDDKVMFGELTFTPAGGVMTYYDDEFIMKWGRELNVHGL